MNKMGRSSIKISTCSFTVHKYQKGKIADSKICAVLQLLAQKDPLANPKATAWQAPRKKQHIRGNN